MDDWEDEGFDFKAHLAALKSSSVGEETAAGAEEEEDKTLLEVAAPAPAPEPTGPLAPQALKPKHVERLKAEERARKAREEEEEELARMASEESAALADPVAEKLRLQAIQEKADLELAKASFGDFGAARGGAGASSAGGKGVVAGGKGVVAGDNASLIAALSFEGGVDAYKSAGVKVAEKVNSAPTLTLALAFYRELLRTSADRLTSSELKDLQLNLTKLLQKKTEDERKKPGSGGGGGGKKQKGPTRKVNMKDDYGADDDDDADADAPAPAVVEKRGVAATDNAAFLGAFGLEGGAAAGGAAGGGDDATRAYLEATANIDGDFM